MTTPWSTKPLGVVTVASGMTVSMMKEEEEGKALIDVTYHDRAPVRLEVLAVEVCPLGGFADTVEMCQGLLLARR